MSSYVDSTRWRLLGEISRIASSLSEDMQGLSTHPPSSSPSQLEDMIPELTLPFPHELLTGISLLQIPDYICQPVLRLLRSRILQVHQEYISSYKRTCLKTSNSASTLGHNFAEIHRVYQCSYEKHCLPMIKALISFALANASKHQKSVAYEERRAFNAEYTPVFEKYFKYNAYPSAQHQSILAEKSMMTRRQIEVWFQNHRNRAKKDERALRRNTTDLPLRMALGVLQERTLSPMLRTPSLSDENSASETLDEEDYQTPQSTSCIDAFDKFRPDHVFPSTYSSSGPDPFVSGNGVTKFPPAAWTRRPANSAPRMPPLSIDMDELARMFHAKLHIFESVRTRATSPKISEARFPWFAATVTIPSRAPLPAFVRAPSHPYTTSPSSSRIFSFQFPSGSRSTTPANTFLSRPIQATTNTRKISSLPRRIPASSNAIFTPLSNQSTSRMSSFSSDYSSRSRSSSSSSRSRTPEPTTPPQLPTRDIPVIQNADCMQQRPDDYDFDFTTLFGDDPDIFTTTSSGSMGLSQNINLAADKQPPLPISNFGSLITLPAHGTVVSKLGPDLVRQLPFLHA